MDPKAYDALGKYCTDEEWAHTYPVIPCKYIDMLETRVGNNFEQVRYKSLYCYYEKRELGAAFQTCYKSDLGETVGRRFA